MKIIDKLARERPAFSFEFFPPKDEAGVEQLFRTVQDLRPYSPTYVSVTWGAGGSTRRLTVELVRRIKQETGIEAMAHLTCVGATREDIRGVLEQLRAAGIENVLPLRGDPPRGETTFVKTEGGFGTAAELVTFIRGAYDFCLAGACYPEKHPEAVDHETDLRYLKAKVDAGADFLVTQLFFENADYFDFVARARTSGISIPIVAGMWPITNLSQIQRITGMCGATLPPRLLARLEAARGDAEAVRAVGVAHAIDQCRELVSRGVPGIHFYTLNRSHATVEILEALKEKR
ncbi:MAG TPA: methylenetetrahydrofolate reductase [NAD(P)H] [Polyangiaceae bacterium]|jgi:methylenetetrahydrofolate reductase (NADPH)|nr:methylenetetrahydrofolate reductase [NAD(P)H] [Polyangiaceae bacterium]